MNGAVKIKKNIPEAWLAVSLILLASALAFLPLVTELGYYHDDWFTTASRVTGTPLTVMHSIDRPGMGQIYQLVSDLLGEAPIAWHLFAWAVRAAGGLAFLWLARMLWPGQTLATTLMAVLYAVYAGFLQQPSANNYSNHLLAYSASIFSLALTVRAVRSPRWPAKIILFLPALAAAYWYPRVYEAMVGVEALRFILIRYALRGEPAHGFWKRAGKSLLWFTPFLLVTSYFIYYRLFIFESQRMSVDAESLLAQYSQNIIGMGGVLITNLLKDFFETTLGAWVIPIYQLGLSVRVRYFFLAIGIGLAAFLLILIYSRLVRHDQAEDADPAPSWARDAAIIGALGLLVTLLPVLLSRRDVQFRNYFDRYTIQSIVPTAMLLIGAIWLAIRSNLRAAAAAGLTLLAVITHLMNAANYGANWELQRQVWWQLYWRAPQLEPGTALIVQMPYAYRYPEGFEVWAPANRIYYPEGNPPAITSEVLNTDTVGDVLDGEVSKRNFRLIEFDIDFANTLILSLPTAESCLHALDRDYELSRWDYDLTRQAARASHIERIIPEGEPPSFPTVIFGKEPEHGWCYYYQKADLARQRKDWQEVLRLGEEAAKLGLAPVDQIEWAPFFEAYLHLERIEEARRLAVFIRETPPIYEGLCRKYLPDSSMVGYYATQMLCELP